MAGDSDGLLVNLLLALEREDGGGVLRPPAGSTTV